MPAAYQQTAGMLYLSNIRTQEENEARTASSGSPNDFKTMAGPGVEQAAH